MRDLIRRIIGLLGSSNVDLQKEEQPIVVSQIDKKNGIMTFMIIMASLFIFLCIIMFAFDSIFWILGVLVGAIFFCFIGALRINQGDTILVSAKGIKEVNWLRSHLIAWRDIHYINVYELGPLSLKQGSKFLNYGGKIIRIKGSQSTIDISANYPQLNEIKTQIQKNYREDIQVRTIEPVYGQIVALLFAVVFLVLFVMFSADIREFLKFRLSSMH